MRGHECRGIENSIVMALFIVSIAIMFYVMHIGIEYTHMDTGYSPSPRVPERVQWMGVVYDRQDLEVICAYHGIPVSRPIYRPVGNTGDTEVLFYRDGQWINVFTKGAKERLSKTNK